MLTFAVESAFAAADAGEPDVITCVLKAGSLSQLWLEGARAGERQRC